MHFSIVSGSWEASDRRGYNESTIKVWMGAEPWFRSISKHWSSFRAIQWSLFWSEHWPLPVAKHWSRFYTIHWSIVETEHWFLFSPKCWFRTIHIRTHHRTSLRRKEPRCRGICLYWHRLVNGHMYNYRLRWWWWGVVVVVEKQVWEGVAEAVVVEGEWDVAVASLHELDNKRF